MNMKNIKTKIILSAIFLSVVSFSGVVNAASASLYISPTSIIKTAGNIFDASVGVNASGNKVCAVEGTLVFNNLTCQSITVASDAMAQSSPTCSNPHFLIGIPNCTTSDKVLLTVSVKAGTVAAASINATGVDIIGEGVSLGSASVSGNYTINTVVATPVQETPQQVTQLTQETPVQETPQNIETPIQETTQVSNQPSVEGQQASLANASSTKAVTVILIILLVIAIAGGLWYEIDKKKKKK